MAPRMTKILVYKRHRVLDCWADASFGTFGEQQFDTFFASFAQVERVVVDIHPDKRICGFNRHISSKGQRIFQCFCTMGQAVLDTASHDTGHRLLQLFTEVSANCVDTKRKRCAGPFLPPNSEIDNRVQAEFAVGELPFVDNQTGIHFTVDHIPA